MLTIAPRNNNNHANKGSGNHAPDLAEIVRLMPKKPTSKYKQSVMTAPQNKEPRTGSPTSQTSKMM